MEGNHDDLIALVASYTGKMKTFLSSNPGLRSRFNPYFDFADTEPGQGVESFELFCAEAGFRLTSSARDKVLAPFDSLYARKDESFGNARPARNSFERVMGRHSNRIVGLAEIDEGVLSTEKSRMCPTSSMASFSAGFALTAHSLRSFRRRQGSGKLQCKRFNK